MITFEERVFKKYFLPDLREFMESVLTLLLNEQVVNSAFRWFAVLGPFVGLMTGYFWGIVRGQAGQCIIRGLAIGCLGPVILVLWLLYNINVNYFGLDTVKNLAVNLILFIIAGTILGFVYRYVFLKTRV